MRVEYEIESHPRHLMGHLPDWDWVDYESGPPFVMNERALLIHRVRSVYDHMRGGEASHWTIQLECENYFHGRKWVELVDEFPKDRILCARCEAAAIGRGKQSAAKLLGRRHVCIGGVRAYRMCGCSNKN